MFIAETNFVADATKIAFDSVNSRNNYLTEAKAWQLVAILIANEYNRMLMEKRMNEMVSQNAEEFEKGEIK